MKPEFLVQLQGKTHVLYAGLLDAAHERGLKSITTTLVQIPSEANGWLAICHATVEVAAGVFSGLGDADMENVSRMMRPHLIRMAETRAKARALRDAVNVGVMAVEELGELDVPVQDRGERRGKEAVRGPLRADGQEPVSEVQVLQARWRRLAAKARDTGVAVPELPDAATPEQITAAGKELQARLGGAPRPQPEATG